jgi:hypothetical protein
MDRRMAAASQIRTSDIPGGLTPNSELGRQVKSMVNIIKTDRLLFVRFEWTMLMRLIRGSATTSS